jgi:general stress protein 26
MIEKNIDNLIGPHAAKKIKKMAEHTRSCTMMTALDHRPISCRPMSIQKADDKARIYFFSHKDSDKNKELRKSAEMQLIINNDKDAEYISLYGYATVYRDQQQIDEMYGYLTTNWFTGKEDPNITIIRFTPKSGHYWSSKYGTLIQFAGILFGGVTGKQMGGGVEGDVSLS